VALERQLKQAIRDAVNRPSRKPFSWGGLTGYRQLSAIADGIRQLVDATQETRYLQRLLSQVERALGNYRALANDLAAAHSWLRRVAAVLHYRHPADKASSEDLSSQSVAYAMEELLAAFQPDFKRQPAQGALYNALSRTWQAFGSDLLHCYDIQGLPPDNLALEALFSALRRHQRRISGHKTTRELRVLGHYQILFQAESEEELQAQLRTVPLARYRHHRQLLEQAAEPRRFINRLHRSPDSTIQTLADAYKERRRQLLQLQNPDRPKNTS
jgi:muconolactone delta-isomerase